MAKKPTKKKTPPTPKEKPKVRVKAVSKKLPAKITPPKKAPPKAPKTKATPKVKEKVAERKKTLKELNKSLENTRSFKPAPKLSGNTKTDRPLIGRDNPSKGDGPVRNPNITKAGRAAEGVKAPTGGLARTLGRVGRVAGKVAAPLALAGAVGGLLSGDSTKSRAETERKSSSGANKIPAQKFKPKGGRRTESDSIRDKGAPSTPSTTRKTSDSIRDKSAPGNPSKPSAPPVPKDKSSSNSEFKVFKKDSSDAKSFREAFSKAEGKDFMWRGRKYSGKKA